MRVLLFKPSHVHFRRSLILAFLVYFGFLNLLPRWQAHSSQSSAAVSKKPKFVIYRILGNDMPPLQRSGQLRWNTEYTIKHESKFKNCEKRWMLNRIVNMTEKNLILALLKRHGFAEHQILDVPFDPNSISNNLSGPSRNISLHPILKHSKTPMEEFQVLGQKIRDITQLNKARNEALDHGLASGARWILCFDGNQFIPDFTWSIIVKNSRKAEKSSTIKYIEVPMVRLKEEQEPSWLNSKSSVDDLILHSEHRMEEGQLMFRNDSSERFNENMAYSLAPKQDLLDRTCHFKSKICLCHSTVWSWKIKKRHEIEKRIKTCGSTVRLFNYPEPEGVMVKIGNGNERTEKRINSAKRFVEQVEMLVAQQK